MHEDEIGLRTFSVVFGAAINGSILKVGGAGVKFHILMNVIFVVRPLIAHFFNKLNEKLKSKTGIEERGKRKVR